MYKNIEILYRQLAITIKDIKNLTLMVFIFYILCLFIILIGYFDMFQLVIQCGICSLTIFGVFKIFELCHCFKNYSDELISYKKWILENDKNIPRIIDYN